MKTQPLDRLKPVYMGPETWLWVAGFARIGVLCVAFYGAHLTEKPHGQDYLLAFYALGFASSLWYLLSLRRHRQVHSLLTWTQVLVDFGVVAATVSFTGGITSSFAFLFVIVILEVGMLLGLAQAFLFASLATSMMYLMAHRPPLLETDHEILETWYDFLVQSMGYYLTAFVSGYWNQRVNRMRAFQYEILDNMSTGFLITDNNGLVVAQNRAGHRLLDLPTGSAIGRRADDVLRVEEGQECPIMTALRLQRDFTGYEFHARTGEDRWKLIGLTTNRIRDARGHLAGLIVSFTDLTEIAHMREELQRQDRMVVVGELAAGLAHEIRNPTAIIRSAMEELQANLDNTQQAARLALMAMRESDHLNGIVSGFLDFARNPSIRREPVVLQRIIEQVRTVVLKERDDGETLAVNLVMPDTDCVVFADRTQMRQVFENIAKNAIEAMEGRGTLTITVVPADGPCEIRFDDEGPGIAPDLVARIFDPFYTTKKTGIGMGLAVCLRIITAHDGTIQAAPREGGGTTFVVRLPKADRKPTEA